MQGMNASAAPTPMKHSARICVAHIAAPVGSTLDGRWRGRGAAGDTWGVSTETTEGESAKPEAAAAARGRTPRVRSARCGVGRRVLTPYLPSGWERGVERTLP